jgi:hypothetical protein
MKTGLKPIHYKIDYVTVIQEKYLCDIILYLLNLGALEIEIPISITVKLGNKELFGHRKIVH